MSFEEYAVNGNAMGVLKMAAINGALWAVGVSWATAIREVALLVMPDDTEDAVVAEVAAAGITTVIGVGVALVAGRTWCTCKPWPPPPPSQDEGVPRSQQLAPMRRGTNV